MVLVEVSIPEVAAREIPRSHRRNQTIGAHGYRKQTVLKRTDEKSLDLELWTVEPRSDQANPGEPRRPTQSLNSVHMWRFMVPTVSHQTHMEHGSIGAVGKEGGDGLMDDGWYEEKNIFPSKDYPHSHAHTHTIQAHTHTHT